MTECWNLKRCRSRTETQSRNVYLPCICILMSFAWSSIPKAHAKLIHRNHLGWIDFRPSERVKSNQFHIVDDIQAFLHIECNSVLFSQKPFLTAKSNPCNGISSLTRIRGGSSSPSPKPNDEESNTQNLLKSSENKERSNFNMETSVPRLRQVEKSNKSKEMSQHPPPPPHELATLFRKRDNSATKEDSCNTSSNGKKEISSARSNYESKYYGERRKVNPSLTPSSPLNSSLSAATKNQHTKEKLLNMQKYQTKTSRPPPPPPPPEEPHSNADQFKELSSETLDENDNSVYDTLRQQQMKESLIVSSYSRPFIDDDQEENLDCSESLPQSSSESKIMKTFETQDNTFDNKEGTSTQVPLLTETVGREQCITMDDLDAEEPPIGKGGVKSAEYLQSSNVGEQRHNQSLTSIDSTSKLPPLPSQAMSAAVTVDLEQIFDEEDVTQFNNEKESQEADGPPTLSVDMLKLQKSIEEKSMTRNDKAHAVSYGTSISSWMTQKASTLGKFFVKSMLEAGTSFVAKKSKVSSAVKERSSSIQLNSRCIFVSSGAGMLWGHENQWITQTMALISLYFDLCSIKYPRSTNSDRAIMINPQKITDQVNIPRKPYGESLVPSELRRIGTTLNHGESILVSSFLSNSVTSALLNDTIMNSILPSIFKHIESYQPSQPSPEPQQTIVKREKTIITKIARVKETILSRIDPDEDLDDIDFVRLLVELEEGPIEEIIEEVGFEYDVEPLEDTFTEGVEFEEINEDKVQDLIVENAEDTSLNNIDVSDEEDDLLEDYDIEILESAQLDESDWTEFWSDEE